MRRQFPTEFRTIRPLFKTAVKLAAHARVHALLQFFLPSTEYFAMHCEIPYQKAKRPLSPWIAAASFTNWLDLFYRVRNGRRPSRSRSAIWKAYYFFLDFAAADFAPDFAPDAAGLPATGFAAFFLVAFAAIRFRSPFVDCNQNEGNHHAPSTFEGMKRDGIAAMSTASLHLNPLHLNSEDLHRLVYPEPQSDDGDQAGRANFARASASAVEEAARGLLAKIPTGCEPLRPPSVSGCSTFVAEYVRCVTYFAAVYGEQERYIDVFYFNPKDEIPGAVPLPDPEALQAAPARMSTYARLLTLRERLDLQLQTARFALEAAQETAREMLQHYPQPEPATIAE